MISNQQVVTRAVVIGIDYDRPGMWSIHDSLDELRELAKTADIHVVSVMLQKRDAPHPKFYFGSGKIDELKQFVAFHEAVLVIADDELSPGQQKQLETVLGVKVTDRTGLILDIFARRAQTREAQLQVELAQLVYIRPRLTRMWTHLSRLGGGIGTRGPGETQLEVDRRRLDERVIWIKAKIEKVKVQREVMRKSRSTLPIMSGVLVGYTNAGKSTLLNQLTDADVLAEDKLFATLDPTTRKLVLPSNETVLISDTVGFIQKLPHELVNAFRATMEEILEANFILHVVDVSHPNFEGMIDTSEKTLKELGADHLPVLMVFNKIDRCSDLNLLKLRLTERFPHCVFVSAVKKENLTDLRLGIVSLLSQFHERMTFLIPYSRMDIVNLLHKHGDVIEEKYEESVKIVCVINAVVGQKILSMLG